MRNRAILIGVVSLLVLAADQSTKLWARHSLQGNAGITLVRGYFDLEYHENPGMAFGLGRNLPAARYLLIGLGIAVLWFVWRVVRRVESRRKAADIAFALVAGGAVGNIIDRLYLGRVVDFILMHWQRKYVWPAYNIADAALVVGVGLLFIALSGQSTQPMGSRTKGKTRSRKRRTR